MLLSRYLGNKSALLQPILELTAERCEPGDRVLDIFAGSLSVSMAYAPALTDALEDIERNLDELPRAVDAGHAEARRLACLEASPITDQERADLIAEETR